MATPVPGTLAVADHPERPPHGRFRPLRRPPCLHRPFTRAGKYTINYGVSSMAPSASFWTPLETPVIPPASVTILPHGLLGPGITVSGLDDF